MDEVDRDVAQKEIEKMGIKYNGQAFRDFAIQENIEMMELFLRAGMDVNVNEKETGKWIALHCVARDGKTKAAEFLIKKGAFVNTRNEDGSTPLTIARENGHTEIADLLLANGGEE